MSYLSTLVGTPTAASVSRPAAAVTAVPGIEAPLEQQGEVETVVPTARVPSAAPADTPKAGRTTEATVEIAPPASVEDALRTAFAWVAPRPEPGPSLPASRTGPRRRERSPAASLEVRAEAAPIELERVVETPAAPRLASVDRSERASAACALQQQARRIDADDVADVTQERVEPVRLGAHAARERTPPRPLTAAPALQSPTRDGTATDSPVMPEPASIQVRIGSIALTVRTPPAPTPPAPAASLAAPPSVEPARAQSAPFAFSAQRHHLRWT